jgi:16S rRNA (guanine1516-N2)-methyltransferase
MTKISVFTDSEALLPRALILAQRLKLPLTQSKSGTEDYLLIVAESFIGLQLPGTRSKPFYIDFLSKQLTYRRQRATVKRETLARALGLKSNSTPSIVDATAGLGRDSYILSALGFTVTLLERIPIIHVLLEDAMLRATAEPTTAALIERMHLIQTDALIWMQECKNQSRPEIIYLDPMFPQREKSALAKKEMRIFHDIIGPDHDAALLLPAALSCATKRVVVKRPRLAENLAGIDPSFSQEGSSSRFDIYIL